MALEIRSLDAPDELHELEKGRLALVRAGGLTVARATYEPGWRWSTHVGARTGETSCRVEHVVLVLQGRMRIRMDDGTELDVTAGDLCAIPAGHDAWVLGDEPYVSIHLGGADEYAEGTEGP